MPRSEMQIRFNEIKTNPGASVKTDVLFQQNARKETTHHGIALHEHVGTTAVLEGNPQDN